MRIRAYCLLFLMGYCYGPLNGQDTQTDSLRALLKTAPDDTNKVHLYWKAGASIIYQDPQASIPLFKQGAELAASLNFVSGLERCFNATSLAFSLNAKYDSALVYINYAVPYALKAGDIRRLALAYLNRADVHANLQNYNASLKDCDTAIRYAEQIGNNDALGRIHSIVAGIYTDQHHYQAAFSNIEKSMQFFEKARNRQMIAQLHSDRADLYNKLEQPAKALPLIEKAIQMGDSLNDVENLAAYYGCMAETLVRMKRYERAKASAQKSIDYTKQTGNTLQRATVYEILYHIEAARNNMAPAIAYALQAYNTFKEEMDVLRQQTAAHNLSEAYFKINDHAQAYKYLKISGDLNDSLLRQQFNAETAALQTTFEVKQKDKEIQLLSKERELQNQKLLKQRLLMSGAVLLALVTLTGTWLLTNRSKLKQRMKELELRNRIAADLHDEVGSSLSSIHMLSQMATQKTNESSRNDLLSRMSNNAKETMDKMLDIVWMIKPGETEAGSLKQRMERFAYEIGSSKSIEIFIQLEQMEKTKLTIEQRKNIYLIFKEALNNAAKYSFAKRIEITASVSKTQLVLCIRDEGRGFDAETVRKGEGLNNMSSRANNLGGELDLSSVPDKGTVVRLAIPV